MILTALLALALQDATTLVAKAVDKAPTLDGKADDPAWNDAKELTVVTSKASLPGKGKIELKMKCVKTADEIFFLFQWKDETKAVEHKPLDWFEKGKKYIEKSEVIEDQFSIGFPLKGEFTGDMYSPVEALWDVWYWGAETTSNGYAFDMTHTFTLKQPAKGGKKVNARNNKDLWILRDMDKGKPPSLPLAKPKENKGAHISAWQFQEPNGSAADVKAKGLWEKNLWTLELSRKLSTGNSDDCAFTKDEILFAIALFDNDEDAEHRVSEKLTLKLK